MLQAYVEQKFGDHESWRHRYLDNGVFRKMWWDVFKIISPTDDFETIKNGITLVARLLE